MNLTDNMKRYYDRKLRCPVCNRKMPPTSMTPPQEIPGREYRDRINRVICGECGWSGLVDDLRG